MANEARVTEPVLRRLAPRQPRGVLVALRELVKAEDAHAIKLRGMGSRAYTLLGSSTEFRNLLGVCQAKLESHAPNTP